MVPSKFPHHSSNCQGIKACARRAVFILTGHWSHCDHEGSAPWCRSSLHSKKADSRVFPRTWVHGVKFLLVGLTCVRARWPSNTRKLILESWEIHKSENLGTYTRKRCNWSALVLILSRHSCKLSFSSLCLLIVSRAPLTIDLCCHSCTSTRFPQYPSAITHCHQPPHAFMNSCRPFMNSKLTVYR